MEDQGYVYVNMDLPNAAFARTATSAAANQVEQILRQYPPACNTPPALVGFSFAQLCQDQLQRLLFSVTPEALE